MDQGRRRHRGAARVHLSEASPLAVLDRIESRGGEASTTTSPTFRRTFRCANLLGYEDLIYSPSLFASPRLDLGFPVRIRIIFLIYYAAKLFNSIWVIVDRLSKVAHFLPVKTTYQSSKLAELYIARIVSLQGVPK